MKPFVIFGGAVMPAFLGAPLPPGAGRIAQRKAVLIRIDLYIFFGSGSNG